LTSLDPRLKRASGTFLVRFDLEQAAW